MGENEVVLPPVLVLRPAIGSLAVLAPTANSQSGALGSPEMCALPVGLQQYHLDQLAERLRQLRADR